MAKILPTVEVEEHDRYHPDVMVQLEEALSVALAVGAYGSDGK